MALNTCTGMNTSLSLPVHDPTQAGAARRAAAVWAERFGWNEQMMGRLALLVTELGNNLALHAKEGGTLLLRALGANAAGKPEGVEILSLDRGPGMANFHQCLRDGYSTAGTAGTGLGAVQRGTSSFEVHSLPGVGTALVCELWATARPADGRWRCGGVSVAMPPEILCGDQWMVLPVRTDAVRVMVADGLGHGPLAAEAATRAAEVFARSESATLPVALKLIHDALRVTRGAAVALAELDFAKREVGYVGIGNIAAAIISPGRSTSLVSLNGTLGGQCAGIRQFNYPWPPAAVFVAHSDGIKSHWQLEKYAGLLERHPSLVAGVLFRDQLRGRDDATIVALQERP